MTRMPPSIWQAPSSAELSPEPPRSLHGPLKIDAILPFLFLLGHWAIILGTVGGSGKDRVANNVQ